MSKTTHEFEGKVKWFSPYRGKQWKEGEPVKYQFSFYPKDRKAVAATGIQNKLREDDDGFHYTLGSLRPILTYLEDGSELPEDVKVGNLSEAKITLVVEVANSKKNGEFTRSTVTEVRFTKFFPFVSTISEDDNPLPS